MNSWLLCLVLAQTPASSQSGPPPEPSALITGRVVDGVSKSPVAAAVVSIGAPGAGSRGITDSVITDGDGRFFFDRVARGNFALTATKPGWIDGAYGQRRPEGQSFPIAIKDGETYPDVEVKLWRRSVMSGAVLDEANEPVVDVLVWAVRRRSIAGRAQMELVSAIRTDDRGAFRLGGLAPGDYSVFLPTMISSGPITFSAGTAPMEWYQTMTNVGAAPMSVDRDTGIAVGDGRAVVTGMTELSASETGASWMSFPPTFFGGSGTTPTFVHLDPGQDRQGMTIAARRVATQSISGTLAVPGGSPASHALHLLPASLADFPLFDVATAITDASGAFTFHGIPAGNYVIRVVKMPAPKGPNARGTTAYVDQNRKFVSLSSGGGPGGAPPPIDIEPLLFTNENVTVGETPIRGLVLSLRPGVRISGRVQFQMSGAQPAPEVLSRALVFVEAANGFEPYMRRLFGQYSEDGTFTTSSLLPGKYVLRPPSFANLTIKSVVVDGRDVTDRAFDVSADVADVLITYSDRVGTIRGNVSRQGAGDPGAAVLLFPADPSSWLDFGSSPRNFISARASMTGSFTFAAPSPGEYFVAAIPDEESADWRDPETLKKLAAQAQRVVVREGESPTVNLVTRSIK